MRSSATQERRSLVARIIQRWQDYRERRVCLDELRADGFDIERVARDVGVSPSQLRKLVRSGPGGADQLRRRLAELGIDPETVSRAQPEVMRDLQRVCSLCGSKHRCERDLAEDPDDPKWRGYCPNAATLDALAEDRTL